MSVCSLYVVCIGYVVYISESRHIQEGPIRQNFPLFIECSFFIYGIAEI